MRSILSKHGAFDDFRIGDRNIYPHYLGRIEPFSVYPDDFDDYIRRFELFAMANNVKDEKMAALFIAIIGDELYSVLRKLVPTTPVYFSYPHIVTVLRKFFKENRNTRRDRFAFQSRMMKPSEKIADYIDELKRLAKNCNYGEYTEEALIDKLISSVSDKRIQQELFEVPNATPFDAICKFAIALEGKYRDRLVRETPLFGPIIRM